MNINLTREEAKEQVPHQVIDEEEKGLMGVWLRMEEGRQRSQSLSLELSVVWRME